MMRRRTLLARTLCLILLTAFLSGCALRGKGPETTAPLETAEAETQLPVSSAAPAAAAESPEPPQEAEKDAPAPTDGPAGATGPEDPAQTPGDRELPEIEIPVGPDPVDPQPEKTPAEEQESEKTSTEEQETEKTPAKTP